MLDWFKAKLYKDDNSITVEYSADGNSYWLVSCSASDVKCIEKIQLCFAKMLKTMVDFNKAHESNQVEELIKMLKNEVEKK